ncbi:hypothetical protein FJY94_00215 [Candidatus Kaiserbacteria bacterium]|nr:hypothetical protein [Candidatus Kaiserbacteria bacterium]
MEQFPTNRVDKKKREPEPFVTDLEFTEHNQRGLTDAIADFQKNVEAREAEKRRRPAHESMRRAEGQRAADDTYGPVRE